MENVYDKLRARLDDLATGYPATESKVEIRLLERLFTEDEAEFNILFSCFRILPRHSSSLQNVGGPNFRIRSFAIRAFAIIMYRNRLHFESFLT